MSQSCPISFKRIDTNFVRIVAVQVIIVALLLVLTQEVIFAFILLFDFSVRILNLKKLSIFAHIAKKYSIKLVHVSTDYVFDGTNHKPYVEADTPNPQSVYGKTKLAAEIALQEINPANAIIIRTSWVYSSYGNNFVKTMLRLAKEKEELGVIYDQIGTPTNAADLAKVILEILPKIKNQKVGVYHYSNQGVCSWYDFAQAIFEIGNINIRVNAIETAQYPTPAKRPFYSVMNKAKIEAAYAIEVPYWRKSLETCLAKIQASLEIIP